MLKALSRGRRLHNANVQHLEANDVVAQSRLLRQRDSADRVLDGRPRSDGGSPTDSSWRARDSKVYVRIRQARAVELFFRKNNLTALREMTLHSAAEASMTRCVYWDSVAEPWHASERIIVAAWRSPSGG
jgi:two-component system sensor histidine kinase KdpD